MHDVDDVKRNLVHRVYRRKKIFSALNGLSSTMTSEKKNLDAVRRTLGVVNEPKQDILKSAVLQHLVTTVTLAHTDSNTNKIFFTS